MSHEGFEVVGNVGTVVVEEFEADRAAAAVSGLVVGDAVCLSEIAPAVSGAQKEMKRPESARRRARRRSGLMWPWAGKETM